MSINFNNGQHDEFETEIAVFENVSLARARFFDEVIENRNKKSQVEGPELRQESVYNIAEFYYLLKLFKIKSADELARLGEAHDRKIKELCDSDELHDKLGINSPRLMDAMFDTEDKIARLKLNCGTSGVRLSQTDLARFMIEYMSSETCRGVIKILAESGYFHLIKSPYGAVLVTSTGRLEEIYSAHIRVLRHTLD